jgi:hypothetical protein
VPALPLVPSTDAERRAIAAVLARHGVGSASAGRAGGRATTAVGA